MRTAICATALLLLAATAAQAQPAGGGFSPEMRAARQAAREACAADAKSYCDGNERRELMMCLRDNADKLGGGCKDALAKLPARPARPG